MPDVTANGIKIEYETFGDASAEPMLLIMGLGAQMLTWDEGFCEMLADSGYFVIRYDNRDVGLSEKIEGSYMPDIMSFMASIARGEKVNVPYTLDDMADDATGLMDALSIDRAHICGASMGGMIAQALAIRNPSRALSMISIMSTTGNPDLPPPEPQALQVLIAPMPSEREGYVESFVEAWKVVAGPESSGDEERVRNLAARGYDRCYYPEGVLRHIMAVSAHGSRKEALGSVKVPTLVIHGSADPLVPVEGGIDTAESIPGAKLAIIENMGHYIPSHMWPRVVKEISEHAKKANRIDM